MDKEKFNRQRFELLLVYAAPRGGYRRFFMEKKKALLLHGFPIKTPPPKNKPNLQIQWILKLPNSAFKLFLAWLASGLELPEPPDVADIVQELSYLELETTELQQNELKKICQFAIKLLASSDPPSELIAFLENEAPPIDSETQTQIKTEVSYPISKTKNESEYELKTVEFSDVTEVQVFGICENIRETNKSLVSAYINVIGIIAPVERKCQILSTEDKSRLFPLHGKIIAYQNQYPDVWLTEGQLGIWKIERFKTGKLFKFKAVKSVGDVYEIVPLPHPSNDYEQVIDWLKHFQGKMGLKPLFKLADGQYIRPTHEISHYQMALFDEPFKLWKSLQPIVLNNRAFVLSPLPNEDDYYDCSELSSSLKKLLKYEIESLNLNFTNKDIEKLTKVIVDEQSEKMAFRSARCRATLETYVQNQQIVQEFIDTLIELPKIKEAIEQRITCFIEQEKSKQTELRQSIETLKREEQKCIEQLNQKNKEIEALNKEVAKKIRATFDRAQKKGKETLANLALYQTFFQTRPTVYEEVAYEEITPVRESNLTLAFKNIGVLTENACHIETLIQTALSVGQLITFRGSLARLAAKHCSQCVSQQNIGLIPIPLGLLDRKVVKQIIDSHPAWDTIILEGINLSDFEVIASALYDIISERIINRGKYDKKPYVLATFFDSAAALPLSRQLCELGPVINIDVSKQSIFDEDLPELDELIVQAKEDAKSNHCDSLLWQTGLSRFAIELEQKQVSIEFINLIKKSMIDPYLNLGNL